MKKEEFFLFLKLKVLFSNRKRKNDFAQLFKTRIDDIINM